MRPGDWICPQCNNHNYADKIRCNKCTVPKAVAFASQMQASARPPGFSCPPQLDVRRLALAPIRRRCRP